MSEDIMYKEKMYCPICGAVMLTNERTRQLPTDESAHKKCADKIYSRL